MLEDCAFQQKRFKACSTASWLKGLGDVLFLHAPAIHGLFSVQGSMCALLLFSWPAVSTMPWPILLPTIPGLAQDEFKTEFYSW